MPLLRSVTLLLCCLFTNLSIAQTTALKLGKIHPNIYVIFGQLSDRTPQNLGNNANFGFIITDNSVVLIDSGASYIGAKAIHTLIKTVTSKPVRTVINTGGQDHRWFGNDYFASQGARIIASKAAVLDHKTRTEAQFERLSRAIGEDKLKQTKARYADIQFEKTYQLKAGNTLIKIFHPGTAHTPGDSFVWLPKTKTVFSGDIIYTQRMLGVIPVSNSQSWLNAFEQIQALKPTTVIPGHGQTRDLKTAISDTYDYLNFLRHEIRQFMDNGHGIENIGQLNQQRFSYLQNFEILKGRNAQKVFEELEWE